MSFVRDLAVSRWASAAKKMKIIVPMQLQRQLILNTIFSCLSLASTPIGPTWNSYEGYITNQMSFRSHHVSRFIQRKPCVPVSLRLWENASHVTSARQLTFSLANTRRRPAWLSRRHLQQVQKDLQIRQDEVPGPAHAHQTNKRTSSHLSAMQIVIFMHT